MIATPNSKQLIADFLRQIRRTKKLTQNEVAKLLQVDRSTITRIEQGKMTIDLDKFMILCQGLNIESEKIIELFKKN
ncbi:MAG: helix-turn-helix transcriptional regulator [Bacteriovoracaceae bacterium]|nr:helix-turn-helix transcriptional regulator [Bacteriovoracaceae bacterium]